MQATGKQTLMCGLAQVSLGAFSQPSLQEVWAVQLQPAQAMMWVAFMVRVQALCALDSAPVKQALPESRGQSPKCRVGGAGLHFSMAWNLNTHVAAKNYTVHHINTMLCARNLAVPFITPGAPFENDMTCLMIGAQVNGPQYYAENQNTGWEFSAQTVAGYMEVKDRPPTGERSCQASCACTTG